MGRIVIQNCNQAILDIPLQYANQLYQDFSIKHPNAFYLRRMGKGLANWDGKVKYINASGKFKIGLLPRVLEALKSYGYTNVTVVDERKPTPIADIDFNRIGKFKLRPEQIVAVQSILRNKIQDIPFHIGVIDYTVNAGKSLIMTALYYAFKKQLKTLLITNDLDWLNQAKVEFTQYLPNEEITYVQGSSVRNWSNFSIGMIQSISRNIKVYQYELSKIDMVLVDEADQAGSKMYKNTLTHLYNTRIRIGLSGTIYMSKAAKHVLKNMDLESFFGPTIATYKLEASIKDGHSTKPIIKIINSDKYFKGWEPEESDYKTMYDETVTHNKIAWGMVLDRLQFNLNYGRIPALVVCKFVKHAENLKTYLDKFLAKDYRIACVHVETPDKERKQIIDAFRKGDIDILVSTTIVARGKNFPLIKYLCQASSMDSQEKIIQFLGRIVRKHKSKSRVYLDDLQYPGKYLKRSALHRRKYYKDQNIKVIIPR